MRVNKRIDDMDEVTRNINYVSDLDDEQYERLKNKTQNSLREMDQRIIRTGTWSIIGVSEKKLCNLLIQYIKMYLGKKK